jgi:MYXO-CTERM domain-containing protein
MPSPTKSALRSRWAPALALLGTLALPGSARADFQITYLFTDEDGHPRPQLRLTSTDMSNYSNQASCQCGHLWGARVFLNNAMGTSVPASTQVRTFVGANCDVGQNSVGQQSYPCVKVFEGLANNYDDGGILLSFEQIWLSSRVPSLAEQDIESGAVPRLPCDPSQTGGGGIWICVESNGQPNCQSEEFVVKGDSSVNGSTGTGGSTGSTGMGGMDMAAATNIQFDYVPPQSTVTGFAAEPGDGAVIITWGRSEVPDISGFRVLCADMDGNAPVTKVTGAPTGRSRTNGKLYYTADNLCPGEVVYEPDPNAVPDPPIPSGSDTGRDTEDSSDGTSSTGTMVDEPWLGDGWSMATGSSSGTTSGGSGTTGDGTGTGTGTSGTGSGSDSGSGSGSDTGDGASSALDSLDWRYVCSDHVANTGTAIRVDGLENNREYQFLVVAYDKFGNPRKMSDVLTATPAETSDFWEQCEQQGDLCGHGGFCSCSSDPAPTGAMWLGTGLLLLGLARRRRGRRT